MTEEEIIKKSREAKKNNACARIRLKTPIEGIKEKTLWGYVMKVGTFQIEVVAEETNGVQRAIWLDQIKDIT